MLKHKVISFPRFSFLKKSSKKGYMITPIIFIAFLLISVVFSFYVSDLDTKFSKGIMVSASIEKGVNNIYKMQTDQITLAKLFTYNCSLSYCYNASSPSHTALNNCVNQTLTNRYNQSGWNINTYNQTGKYYIDINLSSFNATNINMTSDRITIKGELSKDFLKTC